MKNVVAVTNDERLKAATRQCQENFVNRPKREKGKGGGKGKGKDAKKGSGQGDKARSP